MSLAVKRIKLVVVRNAVEMIAVNAAAAVLAAVMQVADNAVDAKPSQSLKTANAVKWGLLL